MKEIPRTPTSLEKAQTPENNEAHKLKHIRIYMLLCSSRIVIRRKAKIKQRGL